MELTKLTISQLINGYKAKQFKPSEVVDSYIKNIENNVRLNAFITTNFENAKLEAKKADEQVEKCISIN